MTRRARSETQDGRTGGGPTVTRREFVAQSAGVCGLASVAGAASGPASGPSHRRLSYLGWQVGLTYQSFSKGGLDREYMLRLLDDMAGSRMNLLSLMMMSYAYFDPDHDGYAWPVQNEKLEVYRDANATNAEAGGEFIRDILGEAADRGIEVQLFLNWGIWNPDKIKRAYPSAALQVDRDGHPAGWLHCPDSPGAWRLGMDEVTDLLTFYDHPNVKSYAFERVSYGGRSTCYCPSTRDRFRKSTGVHIDKAPPSRIEAWKIEQMSAYLKKYIRHVKHLRSGLEIGLHTQCARGWGHDPQRLKGCGVDYLLPHTIQFPETHVSLHAMMKRLAPNPCVLHFCTRDRRPKNYNLWLKTPEIIAEALDWVHDYPGDNLAGILFFNEPATSPANKKAVYEGIKRFV